MDIGNYRLQRVLGQLDDMAVVSPRSPLLSYALNSPIEFLPVTRFPTERFEDLAEEKNKEREVILNQPYRTTPLVTPQAKPRPDFFLTKMTGKPKPTVYRPLDERNVMATLGENKALVNRQFNSPKPLYSQQNVNEAVYVQTGVTLGHQPYNPSQYSSSSNAHIGAPVQLTPSTIEYNPQKSPTFHAVMEQEDRTFMPPQQIQNFQPPKQVHQTAPQYSAYNCVGQPAQKIAQSGSFNRLMNMLKYE